MSSFSLITKPKDSNITKAFSFSFLGKRTEKTSLFFFVPLKINTSEVPAPLAVITTPSETGIALNTSSFPTTTLVTAFSGRKTTWPISKLYSARATRLIDKIKIIINLFLAN